MTRTTNDIFAARLREALALDGRTNEQFARDLGCTLGTVMRWRSGRMAPSGVSLIDLARELNRPPEWFYSEPNGGDDEPTEARAA